MTNRTMDISVETIKELREQSGAGVMECRNALVETEGSVEKAIDILKERSIYKAEKKSARTANQGLIETYVHTGGRIAAMVELNCETDFVARTMDFKELAHNIAMQIAAQEPLCITQEQLPDDSDDAPEIACLLSQPYIKEPDQTIKDLINETIAKTGENIKVRRFARFELGQAEFRVAELETDDPKTD